MDNGYLGALMLGALGGVHCFGMCGGIAAALSGLPASTTSTRRLQLSYNLGRLLSYLLAGILFGLIGWGGVNVGSDLSLDLRLWLRMLANLMLVAAGLYISGWWLGVARLERVGQRLWRLIQPWGQQLLPIRSSAQAILLGMLWGWLPCGLVYSALLWALSAADPIKGGLTMLLFGLGTLPAMLGIGLMGQRIQPWLSRTAVRRGAGLVLILLGSWNLLKALF